MHAAIREVQEETGVKARLVWPLGRETFKTPKEVVTAQYYLMSFVSPGEPFKSEKERRQGWFTYEDALTKLTHKSNQRLLEDAERLRAAYFKKD
jgi:8-oxo-dGTP pyrophosphatase MutT (NUDIX family)